MQRDDRIVGGYALGLQQVEQRRAVGLRLRVRLVGRPVEQAEVGPHADVLGLQPAGDGRQVVRADAGHRLGLPVLRRDVRLAGSVPVALEPQHRRAEQPALVHRLGDDVLDRAEVLADDDRAGAVRLERQHREHRLGVVVHVRAAVRGLARRDPPQAPQPGDVVDADAVGVPQHAADHVAERRVAGLGEPVGPPRRQAPVLAQLVERVGGAAHAYVGGEGVALRPGVGAAGVHADRQVVDDADRHAGLVRGGAGGVELLAAELLEPGVERDAVGQRRRALGDGLAGGVAQLLGPLAPVGAVQLGEGAERRERLEARVVVGRPSPACGHSSSSAASLAAHTAS